MKRRYWARSVGQMRVKAACLIDIGYTDLADFYLLAAEKIICDYLLKDVSLE